jgi:pre-mRNA cleavage complex 2 protein Pcf11
VTEGTATSKSGAVKKEPKEQFVFVPTDARHVNLPCSICQEKFEQGWDEATQQPTWKDAVKVGNKFYHASCYAEVTRGAAAVASAAMERTASSSARSTPDPVLGKRRFDDYRLDAASTS